MKEIIFMSMQGCPYCRNAKKAIAELKEENEKFSELKISEIDENEQPEQAKKFAKFYYYVPTMFVDGEKIYEAHPGESYEECRKNIAKVFSAAVE